MVAVQEVLVRKLAGAEVFVQDIRPGVMEVLAPASVSEVGEDTAISRSKALLQMRRDIWSNRRNF